MISNDFGNLRYFTFKIFPHEKINHGIFTRLGGVSPDSFSSLNVGETAGDTRENVVENRKRILQVFDKSIDSVFDVWQIHSEKVIFTNLPRKSGTTHEQADAILTDSKDVSLFMQFADCVPILIYDPKNSIIGIVHAGWQGTVKRIVQNAVNYLIDKFSSDPEQILAGIGPSIGPDHYEVGKNVMIEVDGQLREIRSEVLISKNGKTYFDLWKSNELLLRQSGVKNIEVAGICTACNLDDWYSYRLEGQKSGRFGVFVSLK
ncbi:MAG: peptidoglycan editing factor PgeF [Anaerolineaceae bacterium]|nr:peptidoglycan editing factor PgeF [Anaerolineaceae bacterium]